MSDIRPDFLTAQLRYDDLDEWTPMSIKDRDAARCKVADLREELEECTMRAAEIKVEIEDLLESLREEW